MMIDQCLWMTRHISLPTRIRLWLDRHHPQFRTAMFIGNEHRRTSIRRRHYGRAGCRSSSLHRINPGELSLCGLLQAELLHIAAQMVWATVAFSRGSFRTGAPADGVAVFTPGWNTASTDSPA